MAMKFLQYLQLDIKQDIRKNRNSSAFQITDLILIWPDI